ncbi:class I SAM-dependent methyltransferase [Litoricolaceae bacterium]|nr:class I SAM-dependent methyltransferase [Litorivicinaceae bacterium]
MNWKHGYFAESGYTYGFYVEASPARLQWAALLQGIHAPTENYRYLDLGCGQGFHLLQLAALHPNSDFVGIDFMPEHIAHGRYLARAAGLSNVTFIEGDFIEWSNSTDSLGVFDYVIAHGITTWVSSEVRTALFQLASLVLKPGGLMYNSYNTQPGWLSMAPFQNLVLEFQKQSNGKDAIGSAQQVMSKIHDLGGDLFKVIPDLQQQLQALGGKDPAYLVQEYKHEFWEPMYSNRMLDLAYQHKLQLLSSATLPEIFDESYTPEIRQLISEQKDPILRETVKDLLSAQAFRRDIYVKGAFRRWKRLSERELLAQRFLHTNRAQPSQSDDFIFEAGNKRITGNNILCNALLDGCGQHGASVADLLGHNPTVDRNSILRIISLLVHGGWLSFEGTGDSSKAKALNHAVTEAILDGAPYAYLCCSKLSQAIKLPNLDMMLIGLVANFSDHAEFKHMLLHHMDALGIRFSIDGTAVEDPQEKNRKADMAIDEFHKARYPYYKWAGAID